MKGYGMMIIIDHGKKLMSLYAHNKVLLKNKGDIVHKGEIISMSGQSGGNLINSLYFEIRQNGVPQNPHEWCNISNKFSLAQ
jgi:septal ring factor EnvC (AmiA/AmiB activator)